MSKKPATDPADVPRPPRRNWIRTVRDLTGLTQEKFGEAIGARSPRERVGAWESDAGAPSFKYTQKIRERFPEEARRADAMMAGGGVASDNSTPYASVSDPGSKLLPPGLGGFLERHGRHLTEHEKDLLRRATHLADPSLNTDSDDFWWSYVQNVLRRFFRPPVSS